MSTLAYQANEYLKSPQSHNKPDLIVSNNIQLADCEQIDIDDGICIEITHNEISCGINSNKIVEENIEKQNLYKHEKSSLDGNNITKDLNNEPLFQESKNEHFSVLPAQHTSLKVIEDLTIDIQIQAKTNEETNITSNEKSARKEKVKKICITSKPPNILVYCESTVTRDNVMQTLKNVLDSDQYTIYALSKNDITKKIWIENATLLVVAGNVTDNVGKCLLDFFLRGGKVLCLCTDLLHIIIPTYRTAEVRENELVQFTYDKWKNIKMMHHIFCYQPSPVKKHFSHDNEEVFTTTQP